MAPDPDDPFVRGYIIAPRLSLQIRPLEIKYKCRFYFLIEILGGCPMGNNEGIVNIPSLTPTIYAHIIYLECPQNNKKILPTQRMLFKVTFIMIQLFVHKG